VASCWTIRAKLSTIPLFPEHAVRGRGGVVRRRILLHHWNVHDDQEHFRLNEQLGKKKTKRKKRRKRKKRGLGFLFTIENPLISMHSDKIILYFPLFSLNSSTVYHCCCCCCKCKGLFFITACSLLTFFIFFTHIKL